MLRNVDKTATGIDSTEITLSEAGNVKYVVSLVGTPTPAPKTYELNVGTEDFRVEKIFMKILKDTTLNDVQIKFLATQFVKQLIHVATDKYGDLRGTIN